MGISEDLSLVLGPALLVVFLVMLLVLIGSAVTPGVWLPGSDLPFAGDDGGSVGGVENATDGGSVGGVENATDGGSVGEVEDFLNESADVNS